MIHDGEYFIDADVIGGLRARSFRGGIITAVAQAAKFVLMLASQVVLARLLLPADFGLVAMVLPVLGFVQIVADLGLTQAIVSQPRLKVKEVDSFFWANISLSAALAVLAMMLAPLLWLLYGEPRVIGVTICSALLIIVAGAGMLQNALLTRQLRLAEVAAAEITGLFASVALSIIAAMSGFGYWSIVIGQAATSLVTTGLLWCFSTWRPKRFTLNRESLALLRFGRDVTIANVASYLNGTLSYLMVGAALGRVILGFYDRAIRLVVQPLSQIQAPFNRVAVPALSRLSTKPDRYAAAFVLMTQVMMLFVTPAMIVASLMSVPLIVIALGAKWTASAPIFAWCCLGAAVTPVNSAVYWLFISQSRSREQMIYGSGAAAINIGAYGIGLATGGVVAVAAVSAVSVYLLQVPLLVWAACRRGPLPLHTMAMLLVRNGIAGAATALSIIGMRRVLVGHSAIVELLTVSLVALITYTTVVLCFPAGRAAIATALHRRSRSVAEAGNS